MAFKISGGQFYPPLANANRIGGAVSLNLRPQSLITVTRAQPGVVAFTAAAYTANEGALLSFGVSRASGASGSIAVDYAITIPEGAPAIGATGTITWNSGESGVKTTVVQLGLVSATRNGQITLSNPRTLSGGGVPTIGGTNPASLQIVDVNTAPVTDVTTFSIEGSGSHPVSFGMLFKAGDVPSGQAPILTTAANVLLTGSQADVLALHPDGSVRHALLHGVATGGTSYKIRAGAAAVGTTKTIAAFLAAVPGSIARMIITGGASGTCDLRDLLSSATNRAVMTNGVDNLRTIGAGPNVLTVRVSQNVGTHLRVNFEVSWYGGSAYWVDCWVVNGYGNLNGMGSASYTGQLEVNGSPVVTQPFTGTPHYNHTCWHPGAETAGNAGTGFWSGASALYVKHNTQYLRDTGAVPNYGTTQLPGTTYLNSLPQVCAAMDNAEMRDNLDDTGAGEELALQPRWVAVYIKSGGDIRAFRNMLTNDNGGAAYGVWFMNSNNGEFMTENEFPAASYTLGTGFGTGFFSGLGPFGPSAVNSHLPSVGFVSYMVTGRQFYLDLMNAWTTEANIWNSTSRNMTFQNRNIRRYYELANRGWAWQLRTVAQAAYIIPDTHAHKAHFNAWVNGVATLYDVPHYGPGGTWRKTIGALYEGDVGAVNYSLFFHMFLCAASSWVSLDLGFSAYLPVAQYSGILMAGLWGSTGEFPFEASPRDRMKLGTTDQTASAEDAQYYETFALVRSNNNIPAAESGTLAMAAIMDSIDPDHTGLRNECRRQAVNDSYFANFLPALSYLHRLGISGGIECYVRSTLCTLQPNFTGPGSQWDIKPRELPIPAYIRNATPLTWTQIPNSQMPIYPGFPGAAASRTEAWGGGSRRHVGSEYFTGPYLGHGDGQANSVEKFRFNSETPSWTLERTWSDPRVNDAPYNPDGRPAARHPYYDQHFHHGRNLHVSHGCSATSNNGIPFQNVDAFDPVAKDFLPAGTFPDAVSATGSAMKAYSLASGCIYYINIANDPHFRRWSIANGTTLIASNVTAFGQQYKAGSVDPVRGLVLHTCGREENFWRTYSVDNGAFVNRFPDATPGLTPTQQAALIQPSAILDYDIRGRQFIYYHSGQEVFFINPVNFQATPLGVQGTPPPLAVNGLYSRGGYFPELDIFAVFTNATNNWYFIKLGSSLRPMP